MQWLNFTRKVKRWSFEKTFRFQIFIFNPRDIDEKRQSFELGQVKSKTIFRRHFDGIKEFSIFTRKAVQNQVFQWNFLDDSRCVYDFNVCAHFLRSHAYECEMELIRK